MAYTYLVGWSALNKYYYGVRFAKKCHPTELWKTYFTSSRHVKEFYSKNGAPDIIKIRKIFDDVNIARRWETRVLHRMRVIHSEIWLNKTNNIAIFPVSVKWDLDRKKRFSEFRKGKPSPSKGKLWALDSKDLLSRSLSGQRWYNNGIIERKFKNSDVIGEEWTKGRIVKPPNKVGTRHSDATKQKMSISHRLRQKDI